MVALGQTAAAYAARTALAAVALLVVLFWERKRFTFKSVSFLDFFIGVIVGLIVLAIWIAPALNLPKVSDSPYSPANCGLGYFLLKLFGSAFVISAAEELFFRRFLIKFAGFWPMVALFAVEHNVYPTGWYWGITVGALAGLFYGVLYLKRGLFPAIVAHATTNLALGIYVVCCDQWQFW